VNTSRRASRQHVETSTREKLARHSVITKGRKLMFLLCNSTSAILSQAAATLRGLDLTSSRVQEKIRTMRKHEVEVISPSQIQVDSNLLGSLYLRRNQQSPKQILDMPTIG
jgi:hypothetical protein